MSAALIPFAFEGQEVRIVDREGCPWFVAADVARVLGYRKPGNAVRRHCKGCLETGLPSDGGEQMTTIIPEGDVYRLIIRSKLPAAERFERWVMDEVLPTIRRTGQFGADAARALNDPVTLRGLLLGTTEQIIALKPKAAAFDRLATATGSLCISDAAKALQVQPRKMFDLLSRKGWIYRRPGCANWLAYADRIRSGHLEHKIHTTVGDDGVERVREQVRVMPRGLTVLARLLSGGAA